MDYLPVMCALLAGGLFLNTLPANFAYDDSRAILKNPDLLPETPLWNLFYDDFWGTPLLHSGSHKSYRPLCVLTFRLNYLLGKLEPWGYHLVNVLCHAVTTFVFTTLARTLLVSNLATLAAGLLFAAHPIHTEAVAGIVGRADVLACLFFLLSFQTYMKYVQIRFSDSPAGRWPLSVLVFVLTTMAMLNKEQAVTVLAVCVVYDMFVVHRVTFRDVITFRLLTQSRFRALLEGLVFLVLYGCVLLAFRIYFMGNKPPEFAPSDNPASDSDSLLTRTLTFNFLPSINFWIMLCPSVLSFDWSMDSIPLVNSLSDSRNMVTLFFYGSLFCILIKIIVVIDQSDQMLSISGDKRHIESSTNSSSRSGKNKANHLQLVHNTAHTANGKSNSVSAYSTKQFYCVRYRLVDVAVISIAMIVFPFIPASNMFFYVGFVIAERILYIPSMGVCLLVAAGLDVLYHKSSSQLRKKVVVACLLLVVSLYSVRTVLRNQDWQTEEQLYMSGIKVNPAKAWGNLANIFNEKSDTEKAEEAYQKALSYRPNMADVHYNLGVLLQNQNRFSEAIDSYKKAIQFRPKLSVAHLNLGILTAQIGDTEQAKKIYAHCADLDTSGLKDPRLHDGTKISCLFNHGRLLMDDGKLQESLLVFHKALDRRPDHYSPQSIYNMIGEVHFQLNQLQEAETWYRKALEVKPDHLPAHLTMSRLMQRKNLFAEAETWLNKARHHHPTDKTLDFHLAQLYLTMKRYDDAIKIYDLLLPHMSNDFDTVYSAANAYREAQLKQKAEELYVAATKLKPLEPSAWMNLGAMLHINNKYEQAEKAYLKGLELRPHDKVTLENLQRLRNVWHKKV